MTKFNYKKSENGYQVYIDYNFKDLFKQHFRSAKWNTGIKCWTVSNRNLKKLEQFETIIREKEQEFFTEEEKKFTNDELIKIENEFDELVSLKKGLTNDLESLDVLIEKLQAKKNELTRVQKEVVILKEEKNNKETLIRNEISKVIDLEELSELERELDANHRGVGARYRNDFHEIQAKIEEMNMTLKKAGIYSDRLHYIKYMNFNRYDRDSINYAPGLLEIETD